jgi:hypothetical protein
MQCDTQEIRGAENYFNNPIGIREVRETPELIHENLVTYRSTEDSRLFKNRNCEDQDKGTPYGLRRSTC